jgi:hypothetical protein
MSFQLDTFVSDSEPTTICSYSLLLSVTGEATHNNIMAICLTRPMLNPTIYRYDVHRCNTYNASET